jgi:isopenicillin N synthase-like dioxygenase
MRCSRYAAVEGDGGAATRVVCPAHTDAGLLTLVWTSPVPGLERFVGSATPASATPGGAARASQERRWAPLERGRAADAGVAVLVGDTLERWSRGALKATPHRVCVERGQRARTSVSFHVYARPGTRLDPRDWTLGDGTARVDEGPTQGAEAFFPEDVYRAKRARNARSALPPGLPAAALRGIRGFTIL